MLIKYIWTESITLVWILRDDIVLQTNQVLDVSQDERDSLINLYSDRFEDVIDTNIRTAVIDVTSVEIKDLNSTPKELVPAPWQGKAIVVKDIEIKTTYGTVVYATNTTLEFYYETSTDKVTADMATLLTATDDKIVKVGWIEAELDCAINEALMLTVATGDPVNWDSPIEVTINYAIVG